jgi:hypothetical protein
MDNAFQPSEREAREGDARLFKVFSFGSHLTIFGGGLGFILHLILGEVALHRSGINYPGPFNFPAQWMPWVVAVATMIGTGLVYASQGTSLAPLEPPPDMGTLRDLFLSHRVVYNKLVASLDV